MRENDRSLEWPTLVMMAATYGLWIIGTTVCWDLSPLLAIILTALAIAQFSSLQHEVLHGHPFANQKLNEALVFPGLTVLYPYVRFRDTHLAHHHDPNLTDPYDDPESNFQDPAVWARLSPAHQALLRLNNTLAGRILLGTAIGAWAFIKGDIALARKGDRSVSRAWALHGLGVAMVLAWLLLLGGMPVWAYLVAAYAGNSMIKVRTFLEHRAHEAFRARTVIIEDRGPLSLLFLNNNFHVVHHCHPQVPWYRLPAMYRGNAAHYLRRNEAYVYHSYAQIFRSYLFKAKDPVPHPIWPVKKGDDDRVLDAAE